MIDRMQLLELDEVPIYSRALSQLYQDAQVR